MERNGSGDGPGPLPPGEYLFRILAGELFTSKQGTPGYKLTREVAEGEAKIALRRNDDGTEHNRVIRFEAAGVEPGDAFEPQPDADADGESEAFPLGANAPARHGVAPGPYDRSERR